MPDLRPRVDDTPMSPKAKRQLGITIFVLVIALLISLVVFGFSKGYVANGTPDVLKMVPIQQATIAANGLVCVELLPNWTTYNPTDGVAEKHCVPIEHAWVMVNQTPGEGTVATITLRHDADNAYGMTHYTVTDSILIWVRTEKERKQYQDIIDDTQKRLFSQRDVTLFDLSKPTE